MIQGVLVHRSGELSQLNVNCSEETLYKRCGFKTPNDFKAQTSWKNNDSTIYLYGKHTGKANTENQREFPPPVESKLFYGKCVLLQKDAEGALQNFTVPDWEKFYSEKTGGEESIGSQDTAMSEDTEQYPEEEYTKEGYHMTGVDAGFIVDDELEEEPYE